MEDTGEIEELRRRPEALEARLDEVAEQQAATRHLAVDSDRDVAALQEQRRADVQLMQALRQTQLEHSKTLEAHTRTLTEPGKLLGALVSGQVALIRQVGAIMQHLGIEPPEQSPQE
jgi:NADPH-dependent ferric siderophore reductase